MRRLRAFLRRHRKIASDTSIFIYQVEANPRYAGLTDYVFEWLARPNSSAVTSTITMAELLVHPYRSSDERQIDEFYGLLSTFPNLDWIAPSLPVADTAARLRAMHGLRTPDALHAATGIQAAATGFITNDSVFERVKELDVLVLEDLL